MTQHSGFLTICKYKGGSHGAHAISGAPATVQRMSWTLPTPLLLFAGVVALLPLVAIMRRSTSAPSLVAEALVTALAVIALDWPHRWRSGWSSNADEVA